MKLRFVGTLLALSVLACGVTTARAEQVAGQATATLSAGTPVRLQIKQELRSGKARKGDPVRFEVASDVRGPAGGSAWIPAGTPVDGKVVRSTRAGAFGRAGRLEFVCETVQLSNGTVVPLRTAGGLTRHGANRFGGAVLGGTLIGAGAWIAVSAATFGSEGGFVSFGSDEGAALGAGIGVGLLTAVLVRGRDVTVHSGATFAVEVARDTQFGAQ